MSHPAVAALVDEKKFEDEVTWQLASYTALLVEVLYSQLPF